MSNIDPQGVNNEPEKVQEPNEAPDGSSPSNPNSQEPDDQLAVEKQKLEAEIAGLEGTKQSLLEDIKSARKERREGVVEEPAPAIDVEALKKELEESLATRFAGDINSLREELVKSKDAEIQAKQQLLKSINDRMASASGARGQSSPDSIVEKEVELSAAEQEIANQLGLKNPRYLKETEVI